MNWSNCLKYDECEDDNKVIMTYCDVQCTAIHPPEQTDKEAVGKVDDILHRPYDGDGNWINGEYKVRLALHERISLRDQIIRQIQRPELKVLSDEIAELKAELQARYRESIGETWYWQGDGEDDLDSLTCPILIEADALRELIQPPELEVLEKALEDDAMDLWRVTNAIKKEIDSRYWITEGHGAYAWDDEKYREETKYAFDAIIELINGVQHPAQLRFHQAQATVDRNTTKEWGNDKGKEDDL